MMDGDVWVEAFLKEDSGRLEMQLEQALLQGEPPNEEKFVSIPKGGAKPTAGHKSTTVEKSNAYWDYTG